MKYFFITLLVIMALTLNCFGQDYTTFTNLKATNNLDVNGTATLANLTLDGTGNYKTIQIPLNACTAEVSISDTAGSNISYFSFDLDASSQESVSFSFTAPHNYEDGSTLYLYFDAMSSGTGNAYMSGEVLAVTSGETVDNTTTELSAETFNIAAANKLYTGYLDLSTEIVSGDYVNVKLNRVADATSDDLASDLKVLNLYLKFEANK